MAGLVDLIDLAQQNTWLMVLLLWLGTGLAYRSITNDIGELSDQHGELESDVDQVSEQVNRVYQKQDHVVSRQEMILERMGMNAQEIQELREETARLDEKHQSDGDFYRGNPDAGDD
jgi:hypothetical protein